MDLREHDCLSKKCIQKVHLKCRPRNFDYFLQTRMCKMGHANSLSLLPVRSPAICSNWSSAISVWDVLLHCQSMKCQQRMPPDSHDEVMTWTHFPHNWPFTGNLPVTSGSPYKGKSWGALFFLAVSLNKLFNKLSIWRCMEILWCLCNITVN